MAHQSFIFSDAAGHPRRAARLRAVCDELGVPFLHLCPADRPVEGATAVELPDEWLPLPRPGDPPGHRQWSRCHLYAVMGARHLPASRHYWLVEADVDGPSATWERLLRQTMKLPEDGLWSRLYTAETHPGNRAFILNPQWVNATSLGCILRVSAAGLKVWEQCAEETREVFTEHCAPSLLTRAGLSIGRINREGLPGFWPGFYHTGTLRFNPGRADIQPDRSSTMLRHPVKRDDPEP